MKDRNLKMTSAARSGLFWIAGLLLWAISVPAQSGPLDIVWEKSDGDFTSVTLRCVAAMPDGELLLGGSITSSTLPLISYPAYLIRTDADGKRLWTKGFSRGPGNWYTLRGSIIDLFATQDGGLFCLENFSASSFFNPVGSTWEYVIKCDASGNKEWELSYPQYSIGSPSVDAIAPAADNGCVIVGSYYYTQRWFITRLDSSGATVWKKDTTEPYMTVRKLVPAADGGFFLGGIMSIGSVDVIRVIKVDSLGNFVWDKTFQHGANTSTTPARNILGTPDGGCMIGGATQGGTDAGPLFLKLNSAGEKEWEYFWSDPNAPGVLSMARTRNGDFLCLGTRTVFDSVRQAFIPLSVTLTLVAAPGKVLWERNYEFPQYPTWANHLFITSDGSYGFLGTRGPTTGYERPLLVKISTEAGAAGWARYGSATMTSPAATGFLAGWEVSALRGTEFEEPSRIMPR